MDNQMAYIYRVSVYSSKRHTKSHTDMYYLKAEHTHWALEDEINCDEDDRRVHYIQVRKDSSHYASAVSNSQLMDKPLNNCCICKKLFTGYGNNPYPIIDESKAVCCDMCNQTKVIPARITQMNEDKNT